MRDLVKTTVYRNFTAGLTEITRGIENTALGLYLEPLNNMRYAARIKWQTKERLAKVKKLMGSLSDCQLLTILTDQHMERFR